MQFQRFFQTIKENLKELKKDIKKNIKIFNPCKRCITRPVCKEECKDFESYQLTNEITLFIILICLSIILEWILIIKLFQWSNIFFKISIISIFCAIYIYSYKELIKESDLREYKFISIILFIIIYHITEMYSYIIKRAELDDALDKFQYRFIKHLR